MLKFLLSFSLFLFAFVARAQTIKIEGLVLDSKTKEPLAFVSVCTENRTCGVSSDIDGKFELKLKEAPKKLYFSYVGYEMFELNDVKENNLVYLKSNSHELQEVVIRAGENPAHIIIRKVQKNKEQNNPVDYKSYQYKAYNKLFITATKDTIGNSKEDTTFLKAKNFLSRQHLFMMEQVLTKKHVSPNKEYSEVLASKVSGFQDPSFLNLFTQMVSFSFYNDLISISDKNYLNPIAEGSFGKYHLILEDTLFNEGDSTFVISFYPRKGKNFDGLKGVLKINSNGYAIENVIAQPMEYNQGTSIKMQQLYKRVDGIHWFPTQLNTDMHFGTISLGQGSMTVGIGKSYLSEIKINEEIPKRIFKEEAFVINDSAYKRAPEYWSSFRPDTLTNKEQKTYKVIDSLGRKAHLDRKLKVMELLLTNRLRYKFIDFELDKFIVFNDYEGFRAGVGLNTNHKFSKYFSLSSHGAYGFKDKSLKYGAGITFSLTKKINLNGGYLLDVIESGGMLFPQKSKLNLDESLRTYLIERMDSLEKFYAQLNFGAIKYLNASIFVSQEYRNTTKGYHYTSESTNTTLYQRNFSAFISGVNLRYAYNEQFIEFGEIKIPQGTKYPVFNLLYEKGTQLFDGTLDFNRVDFKIDYQHSFTHIGRMKVQINSGYINSNLPYTYLYNGLGSNKRFSVSVPNTFETMRMNEFVANKFVALFYLHDFGHLLFKTEKFQPTFAIKLNAGFGTLNNVNQHLGISTKSYEKGFYETGLLLNNLLRSGFSSLGIGAFYRLGPYANVTPKDNLAVKLSLGIAF